LEHAAFLERARLEREHGHDEQARLALAGYVVARLVDRLLTKGTNPELHEGFLWQLDAVRRHICDLPADLPETAHLSGITESVPVDGQPLGSLRLGLTAYGYFLEHEGRLEEALDAVSLAVRTHGDRIPPAELGACALFCGRLHRLLAHWEAATECYRAAELAGENSGDLSSTLRGQLGRAAVLRGQGNLPAARVAVEQVLRKAEPLHLADVLTNGYGDLGVVFELQGLKVESLHAKYRAFQEAADSLQQMRALGDVGVGLAEIGCGRAARLALEIVISSTASFLVRTNALIELMDLESASGNRVAFERHRSAVDTVLDQLSPSMLVDYHFKAGVGLARFGQLARARQLLKTACEVAETNGLNAWYFRVEGVLENLAICPDHEIELPDGPELTRAPQIREVELGLRQYAEMAGV
jgi:tetratricopeptide (TPR) repeat protein